MADKLSLEALRYIDTVSKTRSFSSAARVHGVSQPTLSSAVARTEAQLGDRLFERSTRGVTATAFGQRMLPLIEHTVRSADAVAAEALRWNPQGDVTVRVGVSPVIDPGLVAEFYATAVRSLGGGRPRDIVLREANMEDLHQALQARDLDLILIPSVGPVPRLEHRVIDSEPVVVVQAGQSHHGGISLADLVDEPLLLVPDSCGLTRFTTQLFADNGLTPRRYPGEASSYRVLEEWALMGLGVAVLPRSKISHVPQDCLTTGTETRCHPVLEEGSGVDIFYEAVWDPTSALAADFRALADTIAARPRTQSPFSARR